MGSSWWDGVFSGRWHSSWPLNYQWLRDGTNILTSTGAVLVLTDVRLSDAGVYSVVLTNPLGSITNQGARLVVGPAFITQQPQTQKPLVGESAVLSVGLVSTVPVSYQWRVNDTDLPGQWNASLTLSNLALTDAGRYCVVVSNSYGVVTSAVAVLTVQVVAAWGWGYYGQANVSEGLYNIVSIAAGGYHSLALTAEGRVVAWGYNEYGQTNVPSGLSNVVAIAAGDVSQSGADGRGPVVAWGVQLTMARRMCRRVEQRGGDCGGRLSQSGADAEGPVVAWGDNSVGQTNVPGGLSNVVAIAAG